MLHLADRICVTGHTGLLGSAIVRRLIEFGHPASRLVTRRRDQLDLSNQAAVRSFFAQERPDQVYLNMADHEAGAPQAGADALQRRLSIQSNVIEAACSAGVRKLLLITGSDAYPAPTLQPMAEEDLGCGPLDPARVARAAADQIGIQLCESYNAQYGQSRGLDYRCALTCETYGPGDHYPGQGGGTMATLLSQLHDAAAHHRPSVQIDGHTQARHELMFVDDLAEACIYVMEVTLPAWPPQAGSSRARINLGSGQDTPLPALAQQAAQVVGYRGDLVFRPPSPTMAPPPRRLLDTHRLQTLGWEPLMALDLGLEITYLDYMLHHAPRHAAATAH